MARHLLLKVIFLKYYKLFAILLALIFLNSSIQASNPKFQRVTIIGQNVSIATVLKSIENQTGLLFIYSNERFDENKIIDIVIENEGLDQALSKIFNKFNYKWKCKGKYIVVYKQESTLINLDNVEKILDSSVVLFGKVKDEKGIPIPNVNIYIKGGRHGTTTNDNGDFVFRNFPKSSIIIISSIGYVTRELGPGIKSGKIEVVLKKYNYDLDGAVVAAYKVTTQRKSVGGGISTIGASEIEKKPITNALLALQGTATGVFVNQSTGLSNSGIKVTIRGQNSLSNGTAPLYVIDGVPYTANLLPSMNGYNLGSSGVLSVDPVAGETLGNPLSFINPETIESISILKDADATSIYGSRAASGAILITTKKGNIGETRIGVNMQTGWGKVASKLDLLSSRQYLNLRHQSKLNDEAGILDTDYDLNGVWDTTHVTDWQKALIGNTSHYSDIQISATGGSINTQFLIGLGYHKETSVFPIPENGKDINDRKLSVNFNVNNSSTNQKFHLQLSGNYMYDNNQIPFLDLTRNAIELPPVAPSLYNKDKSLNWSPNSSGASTWENPLSFMDAKSQIRTFNLVSNLRTSYEFLPGLKAIASMGYTNMQIKELGTTPTTVFAPETRSSGRNSANYSNGNINAIIIEPQITYRRSIGNNDFDFLIGSTYQQNGSYQQRIRASGFNSDLELENPMAGSSVIIDGTVSSIYKYCALFGLLNYSFNDRYLLSFSTRRDGSSRFGEDNLFHNFFSVAGAWEFSSEPWIRKNLQWIHFGKMRISYGTSGNDQIGDYKFLSLYYPYVVNAPYQGTVGYLPVGLPNSHLQWEETRKLQLGIDLGFINDRILLNFNYYRNRSSNQLITYNLPIITGFNGINRNLDAVIQNTGYELSVSSINVKRKYFSWSSKFNLTIPQTKLIQFPGLESSPYANSYVLGKPLSLTNVFPFAGIDPTTGMFFFTDKEGKNTTLPDFSNDRTRYLNLAPKFYGGLQNSISFKSFSLDFLFQFSHQIGMNYRLGNQPGTFRSNSGNQPKYVLENNNHSVYSTTYSGLAGINYIYANYSELVYSNADYIRLKNLAFSWEIPQTTTQKIHIKDCRIYIHAQNLLTFTKFEGLDPESQSVTSLPPLRVITLGIKATL